MGICYSSANGKKEAELESGKDKADFKLKKSSSDDFATFISKLGGGSGVAAEKERAQQIPGRLFSNGASHMASLYTQQGKKGTNQDTMIFWENFYLGSDTNASFCGVFDGHEPYGHMVAKKVRDALPSLICSEWESNPESDPNQVVMHENGNFEGTRQFDDFIDEDGCESEETEKIPEMHIPLKKSILKAFKLMDKELKLHNAIDCFCSGTTAVALIKQVEHVIRDEKMMAAYDLLEIYCELVVARLLIIESQKNCPIDLKEAIASLVFAAPRCGDVPELLDIRKQITAKYGKDFTTAAIELRPQCGVGRMLIVKLSASAPDGQTKTEILSAIAEERNVKWEPTSFGEKDAVSPNDWLSGPSSFMKDSEQYAEPPFSEAAQVQAGPSNNTMHNSPSNFFHQCDRASVGQEKLVFVQNSGFSTPSQSEARPAGCI